MLIFVGVLYIYVGMSGIMMSGRWGVSEKLWKCSSGLAFQQKNKPNYLNVEQAISLAAGSAEANHIVPCGNDVIQ